MALFHIKSKIMGVCMSKFQILGLAPNWTPSNRHTSPDSKVHEAYMGPTWGRQDPGGPNVGPRSLAIRVTILSWGYNQYTALSESWSHWTLPCITLNLVIRFKLHLKLLYGQKSANWCNEKYDNNENKNDDNNNGNENERTIIKQKQQQWKQ